MPRYAKEKELEFTAIIRGILVKRPNISIRQIREVLISGKTPLPLDKDYIHKLVKKIRVDRTKRLDYYTVNHVLAKFEDEVEELKTRLWAIITDPKGKAGDKSYAIKVLIDSQDKLLDRMFDAGIFERKLGSLSSEHKLSEESQALVDKALDYALGKRKHKGTSERKDE